GLRADERDRDDEPAVRAGAGGAGQRAADGCGAGPADASLHDPGVGWGRLPAARRPASPTRPRPRSRGGAEQDREAPAGWVARESGATLLARPALHFSPAVHTGASANARRASWSSTMPPRPSRRRSRFSTGSRPARTSEFRRVQP